MHPHAGNGPHRSLNGFRPETIGGVFRADDVANAEPVGQPDDRSQIAGVLHSVERKRQIVRPRAGRQPIAGQLDQSQHRRRRLQRADSLHLLGRHAFGIDTPRLAPVFLAATENLAHAEFRGEHLAYELLPLGHEQAGGGTLLFRGERAHEGYFGLDHGNRIIPPRTPVRSDKDRQDGPNPQTAGRLRYPDTKTHAAFRP